ncbi:hypothetical protein JHK85_000059 [Glycine max]|nr:hypothetical protein JHK85_000059 [Glycine max]
MLGLGCLNLNRFSHFPSPPSLPSSRSDNPASVKRQLAQLFDLSLRATVPDEPDVVPLIDACAVKGGVKFGDYQCNNAMGIWSKMKGKQTGFRGPPAIGQAIVNNLPPSEMIDSCSVAGPGFVNVVLSKKWIAESLQRMLIDGINSWAPRLPVKRALIDFSSPNIAKEMHVGHLRSTIIGDTLARMLEFSRVECVIRRNHVGDWGTQFGMLITNLFEKFPNPDDVSEADIGDLQAEAMTTGWDYQRHQGGVSQWRLGLSPQTRDASSNSSECVTTLFDVVGVRSECVLSHMLIGEVTQAVVRSECVRDERQRCSDLISPYDDDEAFVFTEKVIIELMLVHFKAFYKASKVRFDSDPEFKLRAQQAVVRLQSGEIKYRKAWKQICDVSRAEFDKVYQRLGVQLEERALAFGVTIINITDERACFLAVCLLYYGESFYNPYIPGVLEKLDNLGLIEESDGARVIYVEGVDIPLIAVKRDGGYNYFTTDLASLWYRLNEEKLEWIVYVTDIGQQQHFDMLFKAYRRAGWLPKDENAYPKCTHIGFGLVLGEDGKRFRTRSSEVVRLVDLLDEAKRRCKIAILERDTAKDWSEEEIEKTSEAIGYGAVKYADLKINRLTNYTFNFDQMLNDKLKCAYESHVVYCRTLNPPTKLTDLKLFLSYFPEFVVKQGNTAVYLLYAHARICSIIRKSGKDIEEVKRNGKIVLDHEDERALGLHLLQFPETEISRLQRLGFLHIGVFSNPKDAYLVGYLYCSIFQVVGSPEETSRLLLCEATVTVMRHCFYLLGIEPVYRL